MLTPALRQFLALCKVKAPSSFCDKDPRDKYQEKLDKEKKNGNR